MDTYQIFDGTSTFEFEAENLNEAVDKVSEDFAFSSQKLYLLKASKMMIDGAMQTYMQPMMIRNARGRWTSTI